MKSLTSSQGVTDSIMILKTDILILDSDFVKIVNSQSTYNHGGKLNATPLIIFHNITFTTNRPYNTNVGLFDQLMKYLYENHFKVLTYELCKKTI